MIIAQQKRKDNIAEYLLYLWQVEASKGARTYRCNGRGYRQSAFRSQDELIGSRLNEGVTVIARVILRILRVNSNRKEIAAKKSIMFNLLHR